MTITWRWDRPAIPYVFLGERFEIGGIAENDPASVSDAVSVIVDREQLDHPDGTGIGPRLTMGQKTAQTRAVIAFRDELTWNWYLPNIDRPPAGTIRVQQMVTYWRYRVIPIEGTERAFRATNGELFGVEARVRNTQMILGYGSVALAAAGVGAALVVSHPILVAAGSAAAIARGLFKAARWAGSRAIGETGERAEPSAAERASGFDDIISVLERVDRLQRAVEAAEATRTDREVESSRKAVIQAVDDLQTSGPAAVDRAIGAMHELMSAATGAAREWRQGVPPSIESGWQAAGLDVAYLKEYVESGTAASTMVEEMPIKALTEVREILRPTLDGVVAELDDALRFGPRRVPDAQISSPGDDFGV